ncbi:MAG TPA: GNAT family N-acetyltransferase [Terriglobales bacterium]|nr:GNAT family N-acetyltransferase [Terriglobales bacterium]
MATKTHSQSQSIKVGPLRRGEVEEADRIMRLAFGTYLGVPDPLTFMGDRGFLRPRWGAPHVQMIGARAGGRLIGSNVVTRWGAFGFLGPLTVLPEFWNSGVAQQLLGATMPVFERWGVRRTGLFTFSNSAKHVGLYQKFGYWPGYLTAIMTRAAASQAGPAPLLLSNLVRGERERSIRECAALTGAIDPGLDLSDEIRATLVQGAGDVVLTDSRRNDGFDGFAGFAVCLTGAGTEGGAKTCYSRQLGSATSRAGARCRQSKPAHKRPAGATQRKVASHVKFGAARGGAGAGARFDKLMDAVEAFAGARGTTVEAGVNLAREGAFRRLRDRGYRTGTQGVAMQRPHAAGFNRPGAYVIDDWR